MASPVRRRDPYDVLGVSKSSSAQDIKAAYRKLALKYHPDKNHNNPEASQLFIELASSYAILSDPKRRSHFDTFGFQDPEPTGDIEEEIDLSTLGTASTLFFAVLTKLGLPIKTSISAAVLEEASGGSVLVRLLPLGRSFTGKVDKYCVQHFGVTVDELQARTGIILKVTSFSRSRFKLLYFEQRASGCCELALQEDSEKHGKITTAAMYFVKDLQPADLSELKPGTHIFSVYGDNFFKPTKFTIEALCAKTFEESTEILKDLEAQIVAKRNLLRLLETEYREALARFEEVADRYGQEHRMYRKELARFQEVTDGYNEVEECLDELLREREVIRASVTTISSAGSTTGCFGI